MRRRRLSYILSNFTAVSQWMCKNLLKRLNLVSESKMLNRESNTQEMDLHWIWSHTVHVHTVAYCFFSMEPTVVIFNKAQP